MASVVFRLSPVERQRATLAASKYGLSLCVFIRLAFLRLIHEPTTPAAAFIERYLVDRAERQRLSVAETRRNARTHRTTRRARQAAVFVEPIDLDDLYRRDGAICGLCHRHVSRSLATIDHIVPVARGGLHEYRNVQLAHRACNSRKGTKTIGQTRAF